MDAIEAIEDEARLPMMGNATSAPISDRSVDLASAMEDARVRDVMGGAAKILADAAHSLYTPELEQIDGGAAPETPDDDRAAGRLNDVRLDLLSE